MITQNSFAIAGLTRQELRSVQILVDLMRNSPFEAKQLIVPPEEAIKKLRLAAKERARLAAKRHIRSLNLRVAKRRAPPW